MRKLLLSVSMVVLSLSLFACGKKEEKKSEAQGGKASSSGFSCESVAKKNAQCVNELVTASLAVFGDDLPQDRKEKISSRLKDRLSGQGWIRSCERRWSSDRDRHKEQKAAMEKCFSVSDCKEYAKCFTEASGMRKGMHRGRMGRDGAMDAMGGEAPMDAAGGEAPMDAAGGEAPMDAMGEAPMDAAGGEAPMDAPK